ncbi:B3 domain-containing transcription factor [Stylosanthes scabra]|uniref:B3 domain-containing transcription factor n=1 Tax=Stylosanthes scabra TaxID=79078 RepID=A0ABU6UG26_9FABA|nr:B3 domain-containing transcription factor [Stylosanthes scabra]
MFYDEFPPLPDFPCMSSSSSSSSTPALPLKNLTCSTTSATTTTATTSSSSSSASSWAVLKPEAEENNNNNDDAEWNYCNKQDIYMHHHDPLEATTPAGGALSSTASMEVSQPQQFPDQAGFDGGGGGDCMDDVMDTFGYMELLESNEFFDPSSIFEGEENPFTQEVQVLPNQEEEQQQHQQEKHAIFENQNDLAFLGQQQEAEEGVSNNYQQFLGNDAEIQGGGGGGAMADDEMSMVFLEWLKSNKDSVSASDLRNVKLKKSTIESAAKRLGGGKEAMKQLLKLILEWVQTSHLQNKRRKENNNNNDNDGVANTFTEPFQDPTHQNQNNAINASGSFETEPNTCFMHQPWMADQTPLIASAAPPPPPQSQPQPQFQQPMVGYVGDPYTNGAVANTIHGSNFQHGNEYHMLETANSWPPSQFTVAPHYAQPFGDHNMNSFQPPPVAAAFGGFGNQYPYQFFHGPGGDGLMRLGPSATKEARKKRMARQRRLSSHHPRHQINLQSQGSDPNARLGVGENCTGGVVSAAAAAAHHGNPAANWVYWPTMGGGVASIAPVAPAEAVRVDKPAMQTQNYHHQGRLSSDRRQGWKPEKNLRFLLQKVLKQSDVGSLGRIVLPKKEAETHLPELEARDGITITMEDIGTSRVWNMRYRYWPNNKSRMYLLENTGDFVRANGLQEGDFIVIYSDVKCGKYMIRGVKVRQQPGAKPAESKKTGKSQKNQHVNNAAPPTNATPSSTHRKK